MTGRRKSGARRQSQGVRRTKNIRKSKNIRDNGSMFDNWTDECLMIGCKSGTDRNMVSDEMMREKEKLIEEVKRRQRNSKTS